MIPIGVYEVVRGKGYIDLVETDIGAYLVVIGSGVYSNNRYRVYEVVIGREYVVVVVGKGQYVEVIGRVCVEVID